MNWNRYTFNKAFMLHWHWCLLDYPDLKSRSSVPTVLEIDIFLMGGEL